MGTHGTRGGRILGGYEGCENGFLASKIARLSVRSLTVFHVGQLEGPSSLGGGSLKKWKAKG